jgi:outer membrane receptor protein involved in Fe transport
MISFKFSRVSLAVLLVAGPLTSLQAHDTAKGQNGGAVVDVAGHHVEFVPSSKEMTFYLTGNDDTPIVSAGAKTKAIIQDGGKTVQLDLTPAEPNKLVTAVASPLGTGAKVVVTGTLSDGHVLQAKFVLP